MRAIFNLEVPIAASSSCGDLQFRPGVHLVDAYETGGGDSNELSGAVVESVVVPAFEGRGARRILELHRHLGVCALKSSALVLRR